MHRLRSALFILICCISLLEGVDSSLKRIELVLAPEWLHLKRIKEGGTRQSGDLIGIRAIATRIKRYGFYGAIDGSYAEGMLYGNSPTFRHLESRAKVGYIEGRLGFTFQDKIRAKLSFTPFIGGGYFYEGTNFGSGAPLRLKSKIDYGYGLVGFLSSIQCTEKWRASLLFKAKVPYDPRCSLSGASDHESVKQKVAERLHYSIEFPITCELTQLPRKGTLHLFINPSFEIRKYGSHPNYPFDFFQTEFRQWGLSFGLDSIF